MKKLFILFAICAFPMLSIAQTGMKYAHVNSDKILKVMPDVIEGQKKLQALAQQYKSQFASEEARLGKYGQAIQNSDTTEAALAKMMTEYERQVGEYQKKVYTKEGELRQKENELRVSVSKKIEAAISIVAEQEKIDYIFDASTVKLWYSGGGRDVTDLVIKALGITE